MTELVSSFQICHHGLSMLCHLSLQLPRSWAGYRDCRDCTDLLPSRNKPRLGWQYRKNRVFLYHYRVSAGSCPFGHCIFAYNRELATSSGCHLSTSLVVAQPMSSLSLATPHAQSGPESPSLMDLSLALVSSWGSWLVLANVLLL